MPPIERHMPPAPQRTPEIRHVQGGMAVDNFNAYLYEPTECLRTHDDQMRSWGSAASHGCANIYCMQALHQYFGCKMQRGLNPVLFSLRHPQSLKSQERVQTLSISFIYLTRLFPLLFS